MAKIPGSQCTALVLLRTATYGILLLRSSIQVRTIKRTFNYVGITCVYRKYYLVCDTIVRIARSVQVVCVSVYFVQHTKVLKRNLKYPLSFNVPRGSYCSESPYVKKRCTRYEIRIDSWEERRRLLGAFSCTNRFLFGKKKKLGGVPMIQQ